jgi:ATP-binding cassette subfamily B protein
MGDRANRGEVSMSKYKCVRQHDITDCGAACIATVCLQYKKEMTITKLRDMSGTDIKGTTVFGLVQTLERLGFEAKAGRMSREEFDKTFTLPMIAHIITKEGLSHFVVVQKVYKKHILIADPAKGLRKITKDEFFEDFDNGVVLCAPTNEFIADKTKTGGVFNRFFKLLLAQKRLFVYAIIGSMILTVLGIAGSFFSKILMDEILPYNLKNQLLIFCIGFGIVGFFSILLSAARQHLLLHLSLKIDIPLMLGYFKHIFGLPMKFFGTRRTGDILTRFSDAGTIKNIFTTISLSLIIDIVLAVVSGIILFIMNKTLFAIIAVLTLVNIVLVYVFKKPYKELNLQSMEKGAALNSQIIDSVSNKGYSDGGENIIETKQALLQEERNLRALNVRGLIAESDFNTEMTAMLKRIAEVDEILKKSALHDTHGKAAKPITEFDGDKVREYLDRAVVSDGAVTFEFINGYKITLPYSNGRAGNQKGWKEKLNKEVTKI